MRQDPVGLLRRSSLVKAIKMPTTSATAVDEPSETPIRLGRCRRRPLMGMTQQIRCETGRLRIAKALPAGCRGRIAEW